MTKEFPAEPAAQRKFLLDRVVRIGPTLRASGGKSEEFGTLTPEAVQALREAGIFRLKLPAVMGGAEADPLTEMLDSKRRRRRDPAVLPPLAFWKRERAPISG